MDQYYHGAVMPSVRRPILILWFKNKHKDSPLVKLNRYLLDPVSLGRQMLEYDVLIE